MLRTLWRWCSSRRLSVPRLSVPRHSAPQRGDAASRPVDSTAGADDTVVLYARLGPAPAASSVPQPEVFAGERTGEEHRRKVLDQRVRNTGLCGAARCRQFEAIGIITAGDLIRADLSDLIQRLDAPPSARGVLGSYRRAIRLAAAVPGLTPREARLLASIHRRTPAALAAESPALLLRDLERFALSSRGRKQLRGRALPSPRRVRAVVEAAARQQTAPGPQAAAA